ncbi:MAG TPA: ester cyclase [Anaerolineales bacterium]|nr:ester cyclase [Anaerolineales bacterium]
MTTQENKEFIQAYFEALSGKPKPPELVDQYVAEQPLKDHIAMNEAAFPEYGLEVERMIAEDDLVSVIGRARGTHKGPFMGMPPTGKSWDVPLHITYRVKDGKIIDHWLVLDTAAFMQQLGMIPSN